MEQRFTQPDLPFHCELQVPVLVGTQFSVRATPIEHEQPKLILTLVTVNNEAALEITIHLRVNDGRSASLCALSRTALSESSHQEIEISTIAVGKELVLGVIVKEHVFEITVGARFLFSFVHRVNPLDITLIVLDGAAICSEFVIVPAHADLPLLPAYSELQQLQQPQRPAARLPPYGGRSVRAASQEPPQQLQHFHPSCRRRSGPIGVFVSALETRGRGRRGAMRGRGGRGAMRRGSASPAGSPSWSCFENDNY